MDKKYLMCLLMMLLCLAQDGNSLEAAEFDLDRATFWGRADDVEIYYEDEQVEEAHNQKSWRGCQAKIYEKNLSEPWRSHTYIAKGLYKPNEPVIYYIQDYGTVIGDKPHTGDIYMEGTSVNLDGVSLSGTNGRYWIIPRLLRKINGEDVGMPASLEPRGSDMPGIEFREQYKYIASYLNARFYCKPKGYVKPIRRNGNVEEYTAEWYVENTQNPLKGLLARVAWRYDAKGNMWYSIGIINSVEGNRKGDVLDWTAVYPEADLRKAMGETSGDKAEGFEKYMEVQKRLVEALKRAELLFDKTRSEQERNW